MKVIWLVFLCSMIMLAACSSTIPIKKDQESFRLLNEDLAGERCDVLMADSGIVIAENLWVDADSSSMVILKHYTYSGWKTIDIVRIPTSDIQSIQYTDNGVGALYGLLYGTVTGLVFYALMPGAAEDAQEGEDNPVSRGITGAATAMLFGGMAILAPFGGLAWGAIIGHDYECILDHSDSFTDDQVEEINIDDLSDDDKAPLRVKFSSIVEKGSGYLVILWQGKKIHLQRSEYHYRGTTTDGQEYIVIPTYIYRLKFNP